MPIHRVARSRGSLVGLALVLAWLRPAYASESAPPRPVQSTVLRSRAIRLPGAAGPVHLDYLAADRDRGRVWVPASNTGRVDVIDPAP